MTAPEFTQAVTVWTGVIVGASAVVIPAFMVISKRVADAVAYFQSLHAQSTARLDQHASAIKEAGISLPPIAISTPPASLTAASPVLGK